MIRHHTATSLAAYHDLRQSLIDDQISDVRGVPREFRQGTKLYWYDTYRVGTSVKKRYIGEDSPQCFIAWKLIFLFCLKVNLSCKI